MQNGAIQGVTSGAGAPSRTRMTEPLSMLIGRAQALLSTPRQVKQIGAPRAAERGDGFTGSGEEVGSSCTSQCECVAMGGSGVELLRAEKELPSREGTCEGMSYEVDEEGSVPREPRRGEA